MRLPNHTLDITLCERNIARLEAMLPTADARHAKVINLMLEAYRSSLETFATLAKPIRNAEAYDRLFSNTPTR